MDGKRWRHLTDMTEAGDLSRVGVVGAGTMGNGIAHVFAAAGLDVRLVDVDAHALERAVATIEKNLGRQVAKERISEADAAAALARIDTGTELGALGDAEVVVEAASERPALKFELFGALSGQWNNEDEEVILNFRLNWIPRPGSDLFLVINQQAETWESRWNSTHTAVLTKLVWRMAF